MIAVSVFGLETHDDDIFRAYQLATRHMFAGSQRILRCRGVCARKEQRLSHQRHGGGRSFRRALVAKNGRERRGLSRMLSAWHHDGIARALLGWRTDLLSIAGASFSSSVSAQLATQCDVACNPADAWRKRVITKRNPDRCRNRAAHRGVG